MSRADSPTAVDRDWRFKPERTYRIPSTWAENGRHEDPTDGEERYYAVQIKLGVSLRYGVDAAGEIVDGPHRDKPTVRVCYVSLDGCSAYVRDWDAVFDENGATPESDFASVLAADPSDTDPVDDEDNRAWYREVLAERYDLTPVVADGGQPVDGTDRFMACVKRSMDLGAQRAVCKFSAIRQLVDWLCSFIHFWASREVVFSTIRERVWIGCIHHNSTLTDLVQEGTPGKARAVHTATDQGGDQA